MKITLIDNVLYLDKVTHCHMYPLLQIYALRLRYTDLADDFA